MTRIITALLILSALSMTAHAGLVDTTKKYKLSYTINDNEKTRIFGEVACNGKGVSSEDYSVKTDDCDADGLCSADMMLNTKIRYTCTVTSDGKSYLLGTVKIKDGAVILDELKQNENVQLFKLEEK